jgi:hypothetical protein
MALNVILVFLGGYFFLFGFWKRLKEDYFENQIFATGFYIFTFSLLANIVAYYFLPGYWFWFTLIGSLCGIVIGTVRFNLRFFEVVEAFVMASFLPAIMFLLYDGISKKHPDSFFAVSVVALFIGLYYFLSTRYKSFSWYKSGRVGFTGLAVLGTFFLVRGVVAIWFPHVVSFVEREWLVSGIISFITFLALTNLTLRTT